MRDFAKLFNSTLIAAALGATALVVGTSSIALADDHWDRRHHEHERWEREHRRPVIVERPVVVERPMYVAPMVAAPVYPAAPSGLSINLNVPLN